VELDIRSTAWGRIHCAPLAKDSPYQSLAFVECGLSIYGDFLDTPDRVAATNSKLIIPDVGCGPEQCEERRSDSREGALSTEDHSLLITYVLYRCVSG